MVLCPLGHSLEILSSLKRCLSNSIPFIYPSYLDILDSTQFTAYK